MIKIITKAVVEISRYRYQGSHSNVGIKKSGLFQDFSVLDIWYANKKSGPV